MNPVQELLDKHSVTYSMSGKDFLTKCFNPEHNDNNPSFRIDKINGIGHCFSCGYKFNIFKYYGVVNNFLSIKLVKLKEKLREVNEVLKGLEYPEGYTPVTESFRGISLQTLRKFDAFYTDRVEKLTDRIIFPIKDITGKIVVFVGRHILSSSNPRYINYPSGVVLPMFPSKLSERTDSIIIVEGIFDFLNLYDKGLTNAICCFGTNSLQSNTKEKLLPFRAQGVNKVYILFDGDTAGKEAAIKLKPLIQEQGFTVEIVDLPDDVDPGELGKDDVTAIKNYTGPSAHKEIEK